MIEFASRALKTKSSQLLPLWLHACAGWPGLRGKMIRAAGTQQQDLKDTLHGPRLGQPEYPAMAVNRRSQRVETPCRNALIASWLASVITAFVSGCGYSFFMEHGYIADYAMAIAKGDRNAWTGLLLVGGTTAAFASVVSALTLAFVWMPVCRLAISRNVTSAIAYVSLGVLVSILLAAAISLIHYFFEPLMPRDYLFQTVAILCCGLTASLTFWSVVHADLKKECLDLLRSASSNPRLGSG